MHAGLVLAVAQCASASALFLWCTCQPTRPQPPADDSRPQCHTLFSFGRGCAVLRSMLLQQCHPPSVPHPQATRALLAQETFCTIGEACQIAPRVQLLQLTLNSEDEEEDEEQGQRKLRANDDDEEDTRQAQGNDGCGDRR